jgi:hypothetical protein
MSEEVLNFFVRRSEIDFYKLPVPPYPEREAPLMLLANSNSVVYDSSEIPIPSGIYRSNVSIGKNLDDSLLTSGLMTISLNDQYKSFVAWNMTLPLNGQFSDQGKSIIRYSGGSGIFLREGFVVIDASSTLLRFYFKFDPPKA